METQLVPVGWGHSALSLSSVYKITPENSNTGIPEMGRPEEGRTFPVWSWAFPGIMIPVMATRRRAILIELCIHPWAYPAYDTESSFRPTFLF